mgnify:CR=1 FL=1
MKKPSHRPWGRQEMWFWREGGRGACCWMAATAFRAPPCQSMRSEQTCEEFTACMSRAPMKACRPGQGVTACPGAWAAHLLRPFIGLRKRGLFRFRELPYNR